ncbi:MAG TPA: SDR family NAD(P)-dependent oxidoreductase [Planococcus sp. (in: firmicutes)]|nr:SDR family NAD(P)-dependent oxidoreductase [Planococcus sp. (in: firmicutes)]
MKKYSILEKLMFKTSRFHFKKLQQACSGKTILITGASSGIGEQLAYLLGKIDCRLILVARRTEKLEAMKKEIEGMKALVEIFSADLRIEEEFDAFLDFIHKLGALDFVVSNAGKSINRPIFQSYGRDHDFTRTMEINYFVPVRLAMSLMPLLEQSGGHVVNVSSINALMTPMPHWAAYQASKSAFDTWFRSAAPELNNNGIATSTVYLPLVRTPMIEPTAAYRDVPAMEALQAAQLIGRVMYSKKKSWRPWWLWPVQAASIFVHQLPERRK